jgi:hypothetical protein
MKYSRRIGAKRKFKGRSERHFISQGKHRFFKVPGLRPIGLLVRQLESEEVRTVKGCEILGFHGG